MKSIIYKYPVIFAIIINIIIFYIATYIYINRHHVQFIIILFLLNGVYDRNIMDNGIGMNNKKKFIIITSLIIMLSIFLLSVYNNLISTY